MVSDDAVISPDGGPGDWAGVIERVQKRLVFRGSTVKKKSELARLHCGGIHRPRTLSKELRDQRNIPRSLVNSFTVADTCFQCFDLRILILTRNLKPDT